MKAVNEPTICQRCGAQSYAIYLTREHVRLCPKCYDNQDMFYTKTCPHCGRKNTLPKNMTLETLSQYRCLGCHKPITSTVSEKKTSRWGNFFTRLKQPSTIRGLCGLAAICGWGINPEMAIIAAGGLYTVYEIIRNEK